MTRQYRLQGAEAYAPAPDALKSAAAAVMPRRRLWALAMARVALAVVGVAQVVITGRLLMSGDIDSFRDLGAMGVALGVGFLVAAFQPYRAIGIRPIVVTAALLLVGSALVDLTHHRTTLADEAPHLIAIIGWLLVMFLAWRTPDHEASPSTLRRRIAQLGRAIAPGSRSSTPGWSDAVTPRGSAMALDPRSHAGGRSGTDVLNAPGVSAPPHVDHDQQRAAG